MVQFYGRLGLPENHHAAYHFVHGPFLEFARLEPEKHTKVGQVKDLLGRAEILWLIRQLCQTVNQSQDLIHFLFARHGGLGLALEADQFLFQLLLFLTEVIKDPGDGRVLGLRFCQREIGCSGFQLFLDRIQFRTFQINHSCGLVGYSIALGKFFQAFPKFLSGTRRHQSLPNATQRESRSCRSIDMIVIATLGVRLLVKPARVTKRFTLGDTVHCRTAVHVEQAATQRVLCRVSRAWFTALSAGPLIKRSYQPFVLSRIFDRFKQRGRCNLRGLRISDHFGLIGIRLIVSLFKVPGAIRCETYLVSH